MKDADEALSRVKRRAGLADDAGQGAGVDGAAVEKGRGGAPAAGAAPVRAYDKKSLKLTTSFFWHRLIGTAGGCKCRRPFYRSLEAVVRPDLTESLQGSATTSSFTATRSFLVYSSRSFILKERL